VDPTGSATEPACAGSFIAGTHNGDQMNRDQKAAVVDEVAAQIADADAVFAIDYRGLSVTQAVELRTRLGEADASFRVVKNRLTSRAADKAGADSLKEVLEGPTAFAFVKGDAALAAKALANFRREHQLLAFKGGTMEGEPITVEQIESIARLPGRDALRGQFVGVLASPLTGLVRGLGSMVQGLAIALGQIQERGVVGGRRSSRSGRPDLRYRAGRRSRGGRGGEPRRRGRGGGGRGAGKRQRGVFSRGGGLGRAANRRLGRG
jgi:large subunit ribosomal protein L10